MTERPRPAYGDQLADRLAEIKALRLAVNRVKGHVLEAIPTDEVQIVAIIIALAELQKDMALLFFEEDEE